MTETTATATMSITVVNMADGSVTAHKTGCSDIKRLRGRELHGINVLDPIDAVSQYDVWADYNQDFLAEGEDSGAYDIRFLACCKALPAGSHAMTYDGYLAFHAAARESFEVARATTDAEILAAVQASPEFETFVPASTSPVLVTIDNNAAETMDSIRRAKARLIPGLGLPAIKDFAAFAATHSVEPEEFGYLFSRYSVADFRIAIQDCGVPRTSKDFGDMIAAHRYSRKNKGYDYYADRGL